MSTGTAQHDGPHRTLVRHGREDRLDVRPHLRRQRIARFRPVEGDVQHAAFDARQQGLRLGQRHAFFLPP